jgi:glycosyltransferase involved in cell wall biosynthesis
MNLVHIAPRFAPQFEGGTEAVVRAQARELARLGHRVRVLAGSEFPHAGRDVEEAVVDGLEVAFLRRHADEPYDFDLVRPRLAGLVRTLTRDADLVHIHQWSTLHSSLAREARVPVVATLHDLFPSCPRYFRIPPDPALVCPPPGEFETCVRCVQAETGWSDEALHAGFARRHAWISAELAALRAAIFPSRSTAEILARYVPIDPAKVHCVPHGLSRELERAVTRGWHGAGPLRVLFLGHRTRLKGVTDLAGAVARLPEEERARVELVFLGDELERGLDAELARLAGGARVTFAGNYELDQLAERVRAILPLHLGAFPSRAQETYGLVPDELRALGLPVWVSDRGAPRERIGTEGRVLPAEDPAAWSAALLAVLRDPAALERERAALPARARLAADAVRELEALYRTFVG